MIWKTTWRSSYDDGTLVSNSLHWVSQPAFGGDDVNADQLLSTINEALTDYYLACCSGNITLNEVVASQILPYLSTDVPEGAILTPDGASGTLTPGTDALPKGLVGIMSLQTGVARRWARGYMALPGSQNEVHLDDGNWSGAYLYACNAFAALLDNDYEAGDSDSVSIIPVVYSRKRAQTIDLDHSWAQVQAGVFRTKPHWRRSRTTSP